MEGRWSGESKQLRGAWNRFSKDMQAKLKKGENVEGDSMRQQKLDDYLAMWRE